ncbi:MAG: Ldh family oxidoreductase [Betaproteobacteria bacterium]
MKKSGEALFELARTAMVKAGANSKMAEAAARHLVRADGAAEPAVTSAKPGVCPIDNRDGLPYVSAALAVEEVIGRARANGIGFAGIRNSSHVGVRGIHLQPIAEAGLAGFAFTTVVRGRIMMAMRKGEKIPQGWALDRDGRATTDPKEAIERGSLFPIGGAKGAMLALMFELVCAALTGAAIGAEADSFFSEEGNRPRIGQAFIAVDPGARRFAAQSSAAAGIEVPAELVVQIEKLCTT